MKLTFTLVTKNFLSHFIRLMINEIIEIINYHFNYTNAFKSCVDPLQICRATKTKELMRLEKPTNKTDYRCNTVFASYMTISNLDSLSSSEARG
jgi:hypothetical protein